MQREREGYRGAVWDRDDRTTGAWARSETSSAVSGSSARLAELDHALLELPLAGRVSEARQAYTDRLSAPVSRAKRCADAPRGQTCLVLSHRLMQSARSELRLKRARTEVCARQRGSRMPGTHGKRGCKRPTRPCTRPTSLTPRWPGTRCTAPLQRSASSAALRERTDVRLADRAAGERERPSRTRRTHLSTWISQDHSATAFHFLTSKRFGASICGFSSTSGGLSGAQQGVCAPIAAMMASGSRAHEPKRVEGDAIRAVR